MEKQDYVLDVDREEGSVRIDNSGKDLGDNCIVFENFMASVGDLMVANLVYWRHR
jgi:hypothetical protein